MCGRITRASSRDVVAREFGITQFTNVELRPRYNIAPSQDVEAIVRVGDDLRLGSMRWGFRPSPTSQTPVAPINARAESIASSTLFREAFQRRRCLIVADGFYEWKKEGRGKTPYYLRLRSARPFGLAGVWSAQRDAAGTRTPTCAIITCAPNELIAPLHNRMPVILPAGAREQWLSPDATPDELHAMLTALPAAEMDAYPVSPLVNSPGNDSPECVRPA